jgi:hypothetical protein
MTNSDTHTGGLMRRETLALLFKVGAAALALWALYDHLVVPLAFGEGGEEGALPLANRIGIHLLLLTPTIFYAWGLWLLGAFLGGGRTGGDGVKAVAHASKAFLTGAVMQIVVVPTLLGWIAHRGGFGLDADAGVVALAALALALPFLLDLSPARNS